MRGTQPRSIYACRSEHWGAGLVVKTSQGKIPKQHTWGYVRPLANMRAQFQIETEKVQELVGALRFLPRDFCTGFRAEFQGFARLLSASKWRGNTCTFRARLTMLTCDRQWCFAPITTHKSMPGTSHLGNDTDGCRGSDTANEVLSQRQFCRAYFQASSDLHRPSPIDPA